MLGHAASLENMGDVSNWDPFVVNRVLTQYLLVFTNYLSWHIEEESFKNSQPIERKSLS